MNRSQVLKALIEHLEAQNSTIKIGWDDVQKWQPDTLNYFMKKDLLTRSNAANSIECKGCEHHCFMPIVYSDDKQRAFIVCDHMDMQAQMGRINVEPAQLQQWQTSPKHLASITSKLLGFDSPPKYITKSKRYELGMLKGENGRCAVSITSQPLALIINQQSTTLSDLLFIENQNLEIDHSKITQLINNKIAPSSNYTPNTDKQEVRKLATSAMHQNWNDAYLELKRTNPNESDTWYSKKIEKMPISKNKSSETIRKNMK